jgi:hypothetical protein
MDQPPQRRGHHLRPSFLLTGRALPARTALVLNVLSLTAAFGTLARIFQDGHLGALGTRSSNAGGDGLGTGIHPCCAG